MKNCLRCKLALSDVNPDTMCRVCRIAAKDDDVYLASVFKRLRRAFERVAAAIDEVRAARSTLESYGLLLRFERGWGPPVACPERWLKGGAIKMLARDGAAVIVRRRAVPFPALMGDIEAPRVAA